MQLDATPPGAPFHVPCHGVRWNIRILIEISELRIRRVLSYTVDTSYAAGRAAAGKDRPCEGRRQGKRWLGGILLILTKKFELPFRHALSYISDTSQAADRSAVGEVRFKFTETISAFPSEGRRQSKRAFGGIPRY